jgi:hypothetical protein
MNIYFNNILLNVVGNLERDPDAFEVSFEVEKIKYKGQDVTKIYESLDLIEEINAICKEKAIYGKL